MNIFDELKSRGHDEDFAPLRVPNPTAASPGSLEKVRVLRARMEAGEQLFHAGDAQLLATKEEEMNMANTICMEIREWRESNRGKYLESQKAASRANKLQQQLKTATLALRKSR
jgi:hypothetical protein